MKNFNTAIFKAYDIRGIVGDELNTELAYHIGQALGSQSVRLGQRNMIVARDARLSSFDLSCALIHGLKKSGVHVVDIGMTPTPVLYFAVYTKGVRSGIMVTGSHNPKNYNGFKIILNGKTLAGKEIQKIASDIRIQNYTQGAGTSISVDINDDYITAICENIKLKRPLKIVIDSGNGVSGMIAVKLYQKLGAKVIPLFCIPDGNFPNHHPNPSDPKNLYDLKDALHKYKADLGIAFDGDGDRLGLVDNTGKIIWADKQMMLFAKDVLMRNQGATIIFDVKCSNLLKEMITCLGGKALMSRTGHSFIKAEIEKTGALLGGEMSGHIFFKERWYGFDDALYAGARLLEILSSNIQTCAEIFNSFKANINTPEINIYFDKQGAQFSAMKRLEEIVPFAKKYLTTIDGIRVDLEDAWGLVRPSNTTPALVLRFEAKNEKKLADIQNTFKHWLKCADINTNTF